MRRTTQQTFMTINFARQQKTTKLYFCSQVGKQFKLWTVPFKPLLCCLRSDKLVNCHVWKFCEDLFWNFRVIWSVVNQIVSFYCFLSDFVEITSCVYTKQLFFSISGNYGFRNIYLAASRLFTSIQRVIVNCKWPCENVPPTENFYLFFIQFIGRTSLRKQIESSHTDMHSNVSYRIEGTISLLKERCLIRSRRSSYILTLCMSAFFLLDSDMLGAFYIVLDRWIDSLLNYRTWQSVDWIALQLLKTKIK